MKSLSLLAVLLLGFYEGPIHAQILNWEWLKGAKGINQECVALASDMAGNLYITGSFTGDTIAFDSISLYNPIMPLPLFYTAKYSTSGKLIWAKNVTSWSGEGDAMTVYNNNIYIAGLSQDSFPGSFSMFILKEDSSGTILWRREIFNYNALNIISISHDSHGNVYVASSFGGDSLIIGPYTLHNSQQANTSFFVAKYNPSGAVVWAKEVVADYGDIYGNSLAVDKKDNVFVTGFFQSDSIVIEGTTFMGLGVPKYYIIKYDSAGNAEWVRGETVNQGAKAYGIAVDGGGNAYITGYFEGDSIVFGDYTLHSAYPNQLHEIFFVAKYDSLGIAQWAKAGSDSASPDVGYSLTTDLNDNIYVQGSFRHAITIDSLTLFAPADSLDPMFIVSFDPSGKLMCGEAFAGGGGEPQALSSDPLGNIYVGGGFGSPEFVAGHDSLPNTSETVNGESMYVAKFNCTAKITGIENVNPLPINVYPNPSGGIFYFSGVPGDHMIEVYDLLGRSIFTPSPSQKGDGGAVVNLSGQRAGVYFYHVTDGNNIGHQGKIVVE